ncbi:MAG: glycoside hydrolase family 30 protein [Flammeovirgaceae bacterium]
MMRSFALLIGCMVLFTCQPSSEQSPAAACWITTKDQTKLLTRVADVSFSETTATKSIIHLDTTITYQTMDGFGYTLTGGSAQLIQKLSTPAREALIQELFVDLDISYLRISIGASDLDNHVFSYDDMPAGKKDERLEHFSLAADTAYLLPTLRQILQLNPTVKIMGSPWSAPAWMKDNQSPKGGKLLTRYYPVYANYLANYLEAMAKEGISLDAITIQNEPEHPGNMPSMTMTSDEQREFVKSFLGPTFRARGIATKIIIYDHTCDHPDYPLITLSDSVAKQFVDGTAFHMYLGDIGAMSQVHNAHPDKNIYFTEQWTSGKGDFGGDLQWHVKNLVVGAPRNWSRTVLEWNLAADENFQPHTNEGGCTLCQGAITIHSTTGNIERNVSYYIIGHAAKFVPPGSVRIFSSEVNGLPNVAFRAPSGKKVLIVLNETGAELKFAVGYNKRFGNTSLPVGAVATMVF